MNARERSELERRLAAAEKAKEQPKPAAKKAPAKKKKAK